MSGDRRETKLNRYVKLKLESVGREEENQRRKSSSARTELPKVQQILMDSDMMKDLEELENDSDTIPCHPANEVELTENSADDSTKSEANFKHAPKIDALSDPRKPYKEKEEFKSVILYENKREIDGMLCAAIRVTKGYKINHRHTDMLLHRGQLYVMEPSFELHPTPSSNLIEQVWDQLQHGDLIFLFDGRGIDRLFVKTDHLLTLVISETESSDLLVQCLLINPSECKNTKKDSLTLIRHQTMDYNGKQKQKPNLNFVYDHMVVEDIAQMTVLAERSERVISMQLDDGLCQMLYVVIGLVDVEHPSTLGNVIMSNAIGSNWPYNHNPGSYPTTALHHHHVAHKIVHWQHPTILEVKKCEEKAKEIQLELIPTENSGLQRIDYEAFISGNKIASAALNNLKTPLYDISRQHYQHPIELLDAISKLLEPVMAMFSKNDEPEWLSKIRKHLEIWIQKSCKYDIKNCTRPDRPINTGKFQFEGVYKDQDAKALSRLDDQQEGAAVIFVGPARTLPVRPELPVIRMRGLTKTTTVGDLITSYHTYSKNFAFKIDKLSFGNASFGKEVNVSKIVASKFKFNYFSLPPPESNMTDINALAEFIEGNSTEEIPKKKKKKIKASINSQHSSGNTEGIIKTKATPSTSPAKDLRHIPSEENDSLPPSNSKSNTGARPKHHQHSQASRVKSKTEYLSTGMDSKTALKKDTNPGSNEMQVQNVGQMRVQGELTDLQKKLDDLKIEENANFKVKEDLIDQKGTETRNLLSALQELEDDTHLTVKQMGRIDLEIVELEEQISTLASKKKQMKDHCSNNAKQKEKLANKKRKIEKFIDDACKKVNDKSLEIKHKMKQLDKVLSGQYLEQPSTANEVTSRLIDILRGTISEKESGLECPVCLEECLPPIFSCPVSHLICSSCRPKVEQCPECRAGYKVPPLRHRFAEKNAEELQRLRQQLEGIL